MKQTYDSNPTRSLPTAGKTAHRWLAYGLSLFLTLACLMSAKAQPGSNDASFNIGTGFNSIVNALSVQSDGKIVVVGSFTTFNGITRNRIARLNADGSLDTGFDPGTGFGTSVNALSVQSDGKIVVGGQFTTFNGTNSSGIVRLNADGSLDTGFNIGTGFNSTVNALSVQSDGKIVVGGWFSSFNGTTRNYIARLNTDGSLDTGFSIGTEFNNTVYALSVQSDGKIVVGGDFTTFNGTASNRIVRLNTDGTLDTGFNIGIGFSNQVRALSVQSDGKIVVGGAFSNFNGTPRNYIARLNTDGSLDTGFSIGTGFNSAVLTLSVQSDGKIVLGGDFTTFNGTASNRIARLNTDGTLDTGFNIGTGFNSTVTALSAQSDGKIVVGGGFTTFNGTVRSRIARLNGSSTPTITLSTAVLSGAFSNTATNSTAQTFTASGTGLGADVSLTLSTTDWELSTDNVTFSPTLALTNSGTLSATTVYVRLKDGLTSGIKTADLIASSAGATNKTIALTGTINAFVTTWITNDNQIIIPTTGGGGYSYNVVWTNLTTGAVGNATGLTNDYPITGLTNNDTYQVAITGTFPQFYMVFNATERNKIRTIAQWGTNAWASMEFAFNGCENLTYTATDNPNLSGVTSMHFMFENCTNFNGNIGSWDTSTITDMSAMFANATAFNQNISSWTTSAVTNMSSMFGNATAFNQNIGSWTTNAVTNMSGMFGNAANFNQNIGSWQLNTNVSMSNMLNDCGMNRANYEATLAGWATQTTVTNRFLGANGRQYCNTTDRNILINSPRNWFIDADALSCPTITLSTTILSGAFSNTATNATAQTFTASGTGLTGSVSLALSTTDWELSTDNTNFSPTLALTNSGTLSATTVYVRLKDGLTSGIKTADLIASSAGATNKTIALTGTANAFVTTWVTTDNQIIIPTFGGGGYSYSVVWTNLSTGAVGNATGLTGNYPITGLTNSDTYQVAITGAFPRIYFYYGTERNKIRTIAQWGTNAWTSMGFAFFGCSNLTYTAIDNPNLSGVTSMVSMFGSCTNFNGNIGAWNTITVTNMADMFANDVAFNQNIGSWNTIAVTSMGYMFFNCTNFNGNIGSWNTNAVTDMGAMFFNATAFNQNIGSWQLNSNVSMGSMLDNCGMNIANYDATLAGWATQTTVTNRTLGATGRQYCNTTDRNILINTPRNWTINGDALSGVCLPEINVQGNSVSITDGDLIPTTIDHTDFAVTGISTPIMRTFTIQNTGSATLNISSISNSNTTDFTVGTAPTTVSAGGSATFTVTLNSATTGTKNATITINNDDANEGAYDFAITGKVIFASPAVVCGNMLSLNDGVGGQYITIPHNTAYDGVNALTLEAWVYATNTNNQVVIHKWKTNQFTLEIFSDKLHFVLGGGLGFVASSANFPINQWVHCVGVFNGSQIRIYENGVLTGSVAASGTIPTDALAYDMTIGARSESADGYLSGNIDEVRIWNTARTQAEIRENMHLTSLGSESGLVGYYQFNETTGNAIDAVAGKNGTLQNGATRPESTVSVAKGVATRLTAPNGASTQTFGNATINFTAMSAPASNDEFVTYQLYDRPVNNVSATSTASNYWIVRQFGSQTFSYNQMNFTLPTSNVISTTDEGTPANFKLFKRATNSVGVWGTEIGTGTAANNTTKVITYNISPAQTSFSEFAVASTTSPLPITLLGLKGERVEGLRGEMTEEVKLEWSTGSEINNKGFEVEMSADGRNYEKIAFIEGKGNSTTIQPYSHTTIQPNDGYYRLKQVDFDGKFSYSPIIFIEGIDALKVYPNPNNGTFTISVGKNKLDSPARLLNAVGKEVWRGVQNEVRTTNLPTGVYFLHTVVAGKTNITKIVIKH